MTSLNYVVIYYSFRFTSLGILHVTKKKVPDVLSKRLSQQATLRGQLADQMEVDQEACQLSPGNIK